MGWNLKKRQQLNAPYNHSPCAGDGAALWMNHTMLKETSDYCCFNSEITDFRANYGCFNSEKARLCPCLCYTLTAVLDKSLKLTLSTATCFTYSENSHCVCLTSVSDTTERPVCALVTKADWRGIRKTRSEGVLKWAPQSKGYLWLGSHCTSVP